MRARRSSPLWLALGVIACSANDSHVGCSPTLSCSLREARFKPPPMQDAGPAPCGLQRSRCRLVKIATGGSHTCAIAAAGELFCWGSDAEAQRGDFVGAALVTPAIADAAANATDAAPNTGDAALPPSSEGIATRSGEFFTQVFSQASDVTAGLAHTCVLTSDGAVRCWGRDAEGQVDGIAQPAPVGYGAEVNLTKASAVAAGALHTCALVHDGVACWGSARYGQVGREVMDAALEPAVVPGTSDAVQIAAGVRHSCARLSSGKVLCWGELIDPDSGEPQPTAEATEVSGLEDATEIAAGGGQSCALRAGGQVVCWGRNESGQLGDGTHDVSAVPVVVTGLTRALRVSAGGAERKDALVGHSCAVDTDFHVQCWGRNVEGQLGIGEGSDTNEPMVVLGFADEADMPYVDNAIAVSAGAFHTCSLDHDGPAVCWGDDMSGQLGVTPQHAPPFGRATTVERFAQ
jgi:alpha-tubulin suppressor-like RCC1 family protein